MTVISKVIVVGVASGALVYGAYSVKPEWFEAVTGGPSQTISGINIPAGNITGTNDKVTANLPYSVAQVRAEGAGTWRHLGIAWNGQMGLIAANGGVNTAPGSLMQKAGVTVNIQRQDMYDVMQAELLKFAQAFKDGETDPSAGVHSVTIMGDAGSSFLGGLQPQLDKLGLHAVVIGATGRSYGEDKCMGQPAWLDNPQSAKGALIAAVLRDGDFNICLTFAQNNGIKINPDATTWDPDAINFLGTDSFVDADKAYITGFCEERPVVKDGKRTGDKKQVCVGGTATWTPGDVNVNSSKGGLVSLLSTKENASQMFATIIVIKEWAEANPATTTNFLKAALDGSATIANDRAKLREAAGWSAQVWGEQNADYWEQYYYGRTVDVKGVPGRQIRLGGSQALGLASNLEYFLPAGNSVYDRVYTTFGDLYVKLYPGIMPKDYPKNIIDSRYLEKIRDTAGGNIGTGSVFGQFSGGENQQVGNRPYAIQFAAGSATILPSSLDDLNSILNNVTIGSNLAITIEGYTSSEGDDASNQRLSEARANAVSKWLMNKAPAGLITSARVRIVGMGESNLIMKNGVEDRVASRRTVIRLMSE
jgi:outer membrane protein OmpA-like peptidoglycan-associated protein